MTVVPDPVIELIVTPPPEIKSASTEIKEPVVEVVKPTPAPEAAPTPVPTSASLPTPVQTPIPAPIPAPTTVPVSAPATLQLVQAGDMVYVPGFGWLESQGEGTAIHDDRIYENGNKVGITD